MHNILQFFRLARDRLWLFIWPAPPPPVIPEEPKPPQPKKEKPDIKAIEETGRFYFKDTILDKLDTYFLYINRMRRADREAYDFYSRIGASVVSRNTLFNRMELNPRWRGGDRFSFGAVAFLTGEDMDKKDGAQDTIPVRFMYFKKLETTPPYVAHTNRGTVYQVTGYYDYTLGNHFKHGIPLTCHVAVDEAGEITLLTEKYKKQHMVHHKKGPGTRGKRYLEITTWDYPSWCHRIMQERKLDRADMSRRLIEMFMMTVNGYDQANWDLRVRVQNKHGLVAVFTIDMLRTPYFFDDRNATFNENGRKKRIVHIVRTHKRMTAGGETYVKSHFRGLRRFTWNGYEVNVTLSGLHHVDPLTATFDAKEVEDDEVMNDNWIGGKELAKRLDRAINT